MRLGEQPALEQLRVDRSKGLLDRDHDTQSPASHPTPMRATEGVAVRRVAGVGRVRIEEVRTAHGGMRLLVGGVARQYQGRSQTNGFSLIRGSWRVPID